GVDLSATSVDADAAGRVGGMGVGAMLGVCKSGGDKRSGPTSRAVAAAPAAGRSSTGSTASIARGGSARGWAGRTITLSAETASRERVIAGNGVPPPRAGAGSAAPGLDCVGRLDMVRGLAAGAASTSTYCSSDAEAGAAAANAAGGADKPER